MKICTKCGASKPLGEFYKDSSRKDGRQSKCSSCSKEYNRSYYQDNPKEKERLRNNLELRKSEVREYLQRVKSAPCADCGVSYPYWVMQFDHMGDKKFTISRSVHKRMDEVVEEVQKCEVVCANCHSDRTYRRLRRNPEHLVS